MSTFALLGATGTVGGHLLSALLTQTKHTVKCSVRSKQKLLKQLSTLSLSQGEIDARVKIHEGDLSNAEILLNCIEGSSIVFLCAAVSTNQPGCHIAQDQAEAVVNTLQKMRNTNPTTKIPKVVVLSSAETELRFSEDIPWLVRTILFNCNSNIYNDLIAAERFLLDHEDLVTSIFVKPGGLSHDIARGHKLVGVSSQTFLSYADLAGGMVEIAELATDGERWDGKSVSVTSPTGKARVEWVSVPLLLRGLAVHYIPWLYPYVF